MKSAFGSAMLTCFGSATFNVSNKVCYLFVFRRSSGVDCWLSRRSSRNRFTTWWMNSRPRVRSRRPSPRGRRWRTSTTSAPRWRRSKNRNRRSGRDSTSSRSTSPPPKRSQTWRRWVKLTSYSKRALLREDYKHNYVMYVRVIMLLDSMIINTLVYAVVTIPIRPNLTRE